MKKKKILPAVTHVFSGGKRMTGDEFNSEPYVISTELNRGFLTEANRAFDPRRYEKERLLCKSGVEQGSGGEV